MAPTSTNLIPPTHPDLTRFQTIEEFAKYNNVSVATVKKRYQEIPGIQLVNCDEYLVSPGTRYPFNMRGHTPKSNPDRVYILMKALYFERYISHSELSMREYSFLTMMHLLERDGYIKKNAYGNNFGSNAYDCTEKGQKFYEDCKDTRREKRNAQISQMLEWVDKVTDIVVKFLPSTSSDSTKTDK